MPENNVRDLGPGPDCDFQRALVRGMIRNALARQDALEAERRGRNFLWGYVVGRVSVLSGCDLGLVDALGVPLVEVWRKLSPEERVAFCNFGEPVSFREKGGPKCGGSG